MERNSSQFSQSHTASWIRGKCVGRGAFGTVNIGVSKCDGEVFAVKSVDLAACLPGHAEALENEIRILRSLSSPYVVKYLDDDFTAPSCRNLHMEYLPGGTVMDSAADMEESVVQSRTWCVVSALEYVHSRGVVHCDVKGRNVLVGPVPGQAKLSDFGSAVDLNKDACRGRILPRGSPLWMAPEVISGEYQGPESDVWSLGCTVIEMVTGKPAWEDEGFETMRRIGFSGGLPEFPTRLSETGRDFLDKCLRRDPKERWSCDQLLRHPFLASVAPNAAADSSPRCVLDWVNSEFEDDEDSCSIHEVSAKERIGKLATSSGADWEFQEGWTVVRGCGVEEMESGAFSREETSLGYSDCEGAFSGSESCGGGELVEWARNECDTVGPSGCWYGPSVMEDSAVGEWSVGKRRSKSLCNLCTDRLLLSYSFGVEMNKVLGFMMCYIVLPYVVFAWRYIIKSKYYLIFGDGWGLIILFLLLVPKEDIVDSIKQVL
ncbi:PREDICTED: mitogen-activated protein kinase kinase kinase ANP1-like [Fragaria vesca subsp. vesca]|uniref:mitogen-activated protein kinase kinase kinase ANP1-like n=1 Tax=Fragaria vesca subsp. vesca TaxID=101020 RepID=UPI0002C3036C|nr:PREDICTED: mitogen-activated protein kinase kinase kinase ANP1-like [Fragaria vesca subsp. vesca]